MSYPLTQPPLSLSESQIASLSSDYLTQGVFQDSFAIRSVEICGIQLDATIDMIEFGVSPTDKGGYHLTAPSVFRFLGQLLVIHGQVYLNLGEQKTVEVWVKEHTMKHVAPIRSPKNIRVQGKIDHMRKAHSQPSMVGFNYDFLVNGGAVKGSACAFFDLSPFPHILSKMIPMESQGSFENQKTT
jgi:hypothetical protein